MRGTKERPVSAIRGAGVLAAILVLCTLGLQSQPALSDDGGLRSHLSATPTSPLFEQPGNPAVAKEAPASFRSVNNNGFLSDEEFIAARAVFDGVETIADGLGPTYNAQSCRECHQNVVSGGDSQVTEVRSVRRTLGGVFFASLGGSIIQARGTFPDIVERVGLSDQIRTERKSMQVLGDGFVECIANNTLLAIRDAQPSNMRGIAAVVPVLEQSYMTMRHWALKPGAVRIGRFGWKSEHASLVSFASDAYLNEMGITNPLFPDENLSDGRYVGFGTIYDPVPEPEDDGTDVALFAAFIRATEAPSRGPVTNSAICGERLFTQIGCAVCHTAAIVTAPPGTLINCKSFAVTKALGNRIIHPYSDFLLHDIGTSDGIPIQPTPDFSYTANVMRTAPLWGLRTRNRLFHDSLPLTLTEAIQRHAGQAAKVTANFSALSASQKQSVLDFLDSL